MYVDDGVSAYTFRDRPGWAQMLADVQAGKLDVLLAQAEDRFTRRPMENETLALASVAAGVTFLTVNDGHVDPSTEDGAFFSGLRALLGRMESQKIGTRKRQANAARRERGVLPRGGPRPFGWEDDRRTLRPAEADLVRRVYAELIRNEKTPSAIATAWNHEGVQTSRGGRWDIPKVRALLMRPRNAGLVSYRGEPVLDDHGNAIPPTWQPIVDEEPYRTALAILTNAGRRTAKQHAPKYLCAALATCDP